MKVGDKVKKNIPWVSFERTGPAWDRKIVCEKMTLAVGKVVHINEAHGFYTLEFSFPGGTYKESFYD